MGKVIYLDVMLPLRLKRHSPIYIGARTCTGWGLPLLHVAMQEMQVILQLFTFRQCFALASIVSVALSLSRPLLDGRLALSTTHFLQIGGVFGLSSRRHNDAAQPLVF